MNKRLEMITEIIDGKLYIKGCSLCGWPYLKNADEWGPERAKRHKPGKNPLICQACEEQQEAKSDA